MLCFILLPGEPNMKNRTKFLALPLIGFLMSMGTITADKFSEHHFVVNGKPIINPQTQQPYFFVFVDNTSTNSQGTFKCPYNTLLQAQQNSKTFDIIYVFPGNGTSQGMNAGIILQDNQKLFGSNVSHKLCTTHGKVTIKPLSL